MIRNGQFGKYDADLDTFRCKDKKTNAEIVIKMTIAFKQVNPPDNNRPYGMEQDRQHPNGKRVRIRAWDEKAWAAWKEKFRTRSQAFWDRKFCLINNANLFAFKVGHDVVIPNFDCRFQLRCIDVGSGLAHHEVPVVRIADQEPENLRSDIGMFSDRDVLTAERGTSPTGLVAFRNTSFHEVGHYLGLMHVRTGLQGCPPNDPGAVLCYGVTDEEQDSIMGAGLRLDPEHSQPWQVALQKLLTPLSSPQVYPRGTGLVALPAIFPFRAVVNRSEPPKVINKGPGTGRAGV